MGAFTIVDGHFEEPAVYYREDGTIRVITEYNSDGKPGLTREYENMMRSEKK